MATQNKADRAFDDPAFQADLEPLPGTTLRYADSRYLGQNVGGTPPDSVVVEQARQRKEARGGKGPPLPPKGSVPNRSVTDLDGPIRIEQSFIPEAINIDIPPSLYRTYYYTGGQCELYFQDVLLDEVAQLNFSTVTNKTPIYGYSSMRFDTVARGNLIIQGSFTVNFVHVDYLNIIAYHLYSQTLEGKKALKSAGVHEFRLNNTDLVLDTVVDPYSSEAIGGSLQSNYSEFQIKQAINQIQGLGNDDFRRLVNELELRRQGRDRIFDANFYELPPFQMYATFGDITDPDANSTIRQIEDVYLTAQAQVVNATGEVIQEQYSFIARDIN